MDSKDLISFIPVGKPNAIRSEDLARLVGAKGIRQLQDMIASARLQGCLICSGCGAGYWRPANREELRSFVRTVEARALNTLKVCRGAKERLEQTEGQEYFTDGGEINGGQENV